jgi:hypothetical protein
MKGAHFLKDLYIAIGTALIATSAYAVEPMSESEMGDAVVLDPFGATAAGIQTDITLNGSEESASNADESNQSLALDPNNKPLETTTDTYDIAQEKPKVIHQTENYFDGIQINSLGTVDRVYIEKVIDNTGANRGSRLVQNINVNSAASIYNFR